MLIHGKTRLVLTNANNLNPGASDRGGPLFVWDSWAKRYIVLGILGEAYTWSPTGTSSYVWSYLGHMQEDLLPDGSINPDYVEDEDHDIFFDLQLSLDGGMTFLRTLGSDDDFDGVPDETDNCPAARCVELGLPASKCANSGQEDEDGDGVGNACDFCGAFVGENSNEMMESNFGVNSRADLCDPVPLMRFVHRDPGAATGDEIQTIAGDGPAEALRFSAQAVLGQGSFASAFGEDVAFRFCGCFDKEGNKVPERACARDLHCDPRWASMADFRAGWVKIDVETDDTSMTVVSGDGGYQTWFYRGTVQPKVDFIWKWFALADGGQIPWSKTASAFKTTQGFVASTVLSDGTPRSAREVDFWATDSAATYGRDALRAVLQFRTLPRFEFPATEKVPIAALRLFSPWLDPGPRRDLLIPNSRMRILPIEPWARFGPLAEWLVQPILVDAAGGDFVAYAGNASAAPVKSKFCDDLLKVLENGDELAFLSPVESNAVKFGQNGAAFGAIVPRSSSFNMSTGGLLVIADDAGRCIRGTANQSMMMVPENGQALFSGMEEAVYLVGGNSVNELGTIRKFDLNAPADVHLISPEIPVGVVVLGAAYDPVASRFFVLDVEEEGNTLLARIVRYNLNDLSSSIIWKGPFSAGFEMYSLDLADGGRDLVLTVGTNTSYTAWKVRATDGEFMGRLDGDGRAVEKPTMGAYDLSLPVLTEDGLEYRPLSVSQFTDGAPCVQL